MKLTLVTSSFSRLNSDYCSTQNIKRHKTSIKKFRFKLLMFDLGFRRRQIYSLGKNWWAESEFEFFIPFSPPFIGTRNLTEKCLYSIY